MLYSRTLWMFMGLIPKYSKNSIVTPLEHTSIFRFIFKIKYFRYEFFKSKSDLSKPIGCGYFAVVPEWKIANGTKTLSLNSLSVITYLAKLLGPLREWEERLMVSKECSFNVLHLTPVQKLVSLNNK